MPSYRLTEGFGFNPLRGFRNIPCYCGSGKKAKYCHGTFDVLPDAEVALAKRYLRALSLHGFIEARPGDLN